ncbi:MAG: Gfo/Idh/MocA family protein [Christensenellales bacterium]|jgi:UDP-N-acetyl-2-amino-2-deoxyglucuronate dehydrogenase
MKKVRSAIIGLGAIGPTHAKSLAQIDNAELVAVCDLIPERAQKIADQYGCKVYTDCDAMLDSEQIDLLHVCLPSGLHAEYGLKAAARGVNVLTEKPIDVSLEHADALIAGCRQAGVKLSVISQHRFDDAMIQAHQALVDGRFGQLNFGGSYTKWFRDQKYYDSGDWRGTWELDGGGALMNQSVHYVDMLQYMMGEVEEVTAYCATRAHVRIEVEDIAAAIIKFKSGAVGMLEGNTTAYPGFHTRLDVYGTDGSVIIENDQIREWKFRDEIDAPKQVAQKEGPAGASSAAIGESSHVRQIQDVVNAILEDREPAITGEMARAPLAIILAVYESARTGKAVKLG